MHSPVNMTTSRRVGDIVLYQNRKALYKSDQKYDAAASRGLSSDMLDSERTKHS